MNKQNVIKTTKPNTAGQQQGASYAGHSNKKWPNTSHRADVRSARGESGETK